jgi:hypothetical protein
MSKNCDQAKGHMARTPLPNLIKYTVYLLVGKLVYEWGTSPEIKKKIRSR